MKATGRELRWLADNYEQAQKLRIGIGERIRAVIQGRDETFVTVAECDAEQADQVLADIAKGDTLGPVPMLGRSYRRYYDEEIATQKDMTDALHAHPTWPWLDKVKGMGPTLSCKILARLDIEQATYRSSFWKFCGLATVPGSLYRCDVCGMERGFPIGYKVTGKHQSLTERTEKDNPKQCKGSLVFITDEGIRVGEPKAARGERRSYDAYAKKVLYLIASSFLKAGGPYEELYRKQRARADLERPKWATGRKHFWALRKVEKLFLSHLWEVWREALNLPIGTPYVHAHLGHEQYIGPWEMVD
jgi:hypothetical protein